MRVEGDAVIAAFDRVASSSSHRQRHPAMRTEARERHGIACFAAIEEDRFAQDAAFEQPIAHLVAQRRDVPGVADEDVTGLEGVHTARSSEAREGPPRAADLQLRFW